ncbi:hypothetical protein WA026_009979 [Henosepilachna vigintioctopunctata]|uniref:Glucose-methanol-choline oxidoreductase N-terminal domain-containing protein n=1 Tax=Henosepilachna vigintioctopunctata TaxID=420089 RepID=A0AAW1TQT4_9CUCU
MKDLYALLPFILLVGCVENQIEQKIDYYQNKIENAFSRARCHKIRKDNSDFFKNAAGYKENKCIYTQGKVVGGSGTINGLGYARGNRADNDNWALMGNHGWSFDDVLPFFKKLENFVSDDIDFEYRGTGGPVNIAYSKVNQNFSKIREAYSEIGVVYTQDYNAEPQIGVSVIQRNIKFGRRVSGSTAYVRPSFRNKNLNVTVGALVTKILIEKFTKQAYGIQFIKRGKIYTAIAEREVIISAGTINSAQLLMLSGVGPKAELKKHNIPVISNLAVGETFKDHILFRVSFETKHNDTVSLRNLIKEYLGGEGILTNLDNSVSFSYHNTKNPNSTVPNIEFVLYLPSPASFLVPSLSNYTQKTQQYINKLDIRRDFYIEIFLLYPESSGNVTLKSSSPIDFPSIDLGIFKKENDLETFYEAIQIVEQLVETKVGKTSHLKPVEFQVCSEYSYGSKEYWYCALKHIAAPGLHPSTTTKMGPPTDRLAVVDHRLRVYGVNRLRVADCGIMPTTIAGHNNAVAFMIGEKAADLIKRDHQI